MMDIVTGIMESALPHTARQAPARLSQMRSLLWKELRERWGQAATLLVVGLLIAGGWGWFVDVLIARKWLGAQPDAEDVLLMFWTVVALMASAPVLADERSRASLSFVLAQPISRAKAWWWKLGSAAMFVAVVVGPSWCVYHVVAPSRWPAINQSPFAAACALTPAAVAVMILGWPLLFFSAGLLATALVEGTVTALGLGAVIAVLLSSVLTGVEIEPNGSSWALWCTTLSLALLATSHLSFCARQFWPGRPRRVAGAICLTWACVVAAGIGADATWRWVSDPWRSVVEIGAIRSVGDVCVYLCRDHRGPVAVHSDGGPSRRCRLPSHAREAEATADLAVPLFTVHSRGSAFRPGAGWSRSLGIGVGGRQFVLEPGDNVVRCLKQDWQHSLRRWVARRSGVSVEDVALFRVQTPDTVPGGGRFCIGLIRGREWLAVDRRDLPRITMPPNARPLAWSPTYRRGLYIESNGQLGFMTAESHHWSPPDAQLEGVAGSAAAWRVWAPLPDVFILQRAGSDRIVEITYDRRKTHIAPLDRVSGELLDARWHDWDGHARRVGLVVERVGGTPTQELWSCTIGGEPGSTVCERLISTRGRIVHSGTHQPIGAAYVVSSRQDGNGDLWLVRKGKAQRLAEGGVRLAHHQTVLFCSSFVFIRNGREVWAYDPATGSVRRSWP